MLKRIKNIFSGIRGRVFRRRPDASAHAERELVYTLAKSRVPNFRQLRYLPKVLSKTELFLVRGLSGFIVVALIFIGARTYARNVVYQPKAGGEITEGLLGNPQYVNPVLVGTNDVDRDLIRLMYAGLLRRNAEQELVPDLAETFEVSDDKKVLTFHLRPNMSWSDGHAISADDVLITFEFITDPLFKSPLRSQFRNVKVERVDDLTVRFTLPQPSSAFLSKMTTGILPAHIWGDVPPPNFALIEYNVRPVSSGPFKFDSLKRETDTGFIKEYRLIRNDKYPGQKPYLEKLTFKFFEDPTSMADAVRMKSIEGVSVVTRDQRNALKQVRTVDIQLLQTSAVFFNAKRNAVKPPEVRKALATAINRDLIINEAIDQTGQLTDGPIPPAVPGAVSGVQPAFSLDEANRILEDSGWKRQDGSGIRKKGNDELAVVLVVVEQADEVAVGELIKQNWEAIGAKVEVKLYDPTRIAKEVIKPREYDAFVYGEILAPDVDLYPFWHSTQEVDPGLNLTRFFNKDADKLLDELRVEMDPTKTLEKRQAFQRLLAEGNHVVFLYTPFYSYGLAKRVKGFDVAYVTNPSDRFNNVSDWYVNTRISFQK
ncbi:MAG: hypothetical protein HY976_03790 [Candidatus Kerfeldbacteria bacterium]|nr:hypothetical protein [Candidatus Kerfeldbacteria bacterium]